MLNLQRNTNGAFLHDPAHQLYRLAEHRAGYGLSQETLFDLAKDATDRFTEKLSSFGDPLSELQSAEATTRDLVNLERPFRRELERLAVEGIRNQFFKDPCDTEIRIYGRLLDQTDMDALEPPSHAEPVPPALRASVAKRRLINAIIQGGASHLEDMHKYLRDDVESLCPGLSRKQSRHQDLMNVAYFACNDQILSIPAGGELPQVGGLVKIDFEFIRRQGLDPIKRLTIHAQAQTFAVLLHELSKGALEAIALMGRERDDSVRKRVERLADDPRLEGLDTYLGRELYCRLRDDASRRGQEVSLYLQKLMMLEPDQFILQVQRALNSNHSGEESSTNQSNLLVAINRHKEVLK